MKKRISPEKHAFIDEKSKKFATDHDLTMKLELFNERVKQMKQPMKCN